MVTIYLLRYDLDGERVWYHESMDREKAIRMRSCFQRLGCNPKIKRVTVTVTAADLLPFSSK